MLKQIMKPIYKHIKGVMRSRELRKKGVFVHQDAYLGDCTAIGPGTVINGPAFIASSKEAPVTIGKYCAIAHNLRIRPRNHFYGFANLQDRFQNKYGLPCLDSVKGPVIIGNNVWIGDNVTILSGVKIGDGAVIGAGAVVSRDAPAYSVVVGNPARVIKQRFSDSIISQLHDIDWWNWSSDKIERNRRFFETDLSGAEDLKLKEIIND